MRRTLADLAADLRFSLRVLRKSALASATIVLCLGFSVGATGTVFVWTRSVVSNPVPGVVDPDGLASLRTVTSRGDGVISHPTFIDIRDADSASRARSFSSIAAFGIQRFALRTTQTADLRHAEPIWGAMVSANYFDALGVRPIIGRTFVPDEDRLGGDAAVAVISYSLWQRRFEGAPDIRGQRIWLNDRSLTIIGVGPERFTGSISRLGLDIWVPLEFQRQTGSAAWLDERDQRWLDVFGRLAPGASLESADRAMKTIGVDLAERFQELRDYGLRVRNLDIGPIEYMASISAVVLGLSVLVVLIVCSNVANLLLLRSASREHEMAVRLALGAPPGRVVRQLMTESFILAVGGVLLATAVSAWSRNALNSLAPASPLPIVAETPFDGTAAIVIAFFGLSTVFAFGLAPALKAVRVAVRASLTGGGTRGGTAQSGRLRGSLVSAQFALSLAVLATAGLFIQRLAELQLVDRGFRAPEKVLLATVDFEIAGIEDQAVRQALVERTVERLRALPGAEHAAAASFVPLGFLGYFAMETRIDGYVPQPGESMSFLTNAISPGYFDTMGIPIVDGRPIDATDRAGARPVVVVNEALARRFWGNASAIGRQLSVNGAEVAVVGVAGNGKYEYLAALDAPSPPFVYLPYAQWATFNVVMHVRAADDPLALVPSVRRAVESVDSRLTINSPSTLESYSSVPVLPLRLASRVLTVLGIGALILATLGLYAVIGYAVVQQRSEIGIRMALGASPSRIVRHFLKYAALYAGVGAFIGSLLALVIARILAARLPEMLPATLGTQIGPFVVAVFALGAVSVLAAFIPARAAARVNPTVALREE